MIFAHQPPADFKNYTFHTHPCAQNVPVDAVMRNGTFNYYDAKMGQGFTIDVVSVKTGTLAPGTRQAVVILSCAFPVGGTAAAYLFDIHTANATLLRKIADANWGPDWGAAPNSIHVAFAKRVLSVEACANNSCDKTAVTRYVLRKGKLVVLGERN